jgi:hypothetical protein
MSFYCEEKAKQPRRSEGGTRRHMLPNAKRSRLSSSQLNLPFSIPCLPLGQVHHQFNNAASDIYQYISFIVTNSFIATNMFSELVGLTYKHKETFFVTLWMSKICAHCFVTRFCYRAFFMISNKISWKITSLSKTDNGQAVSVRDTPQKCPSGTKFM